LSLFVDTSVWYAAADASDAANSRAKELLSGGEALVTSDHVLLETWMLLRRRIGKGAADEFWSGLRSGVATIECVGEADLETAWTIGRDFPDQDFSITDRTSFAVMMRLGLTRAVAFDEHFAVFRYGPKRAQALQVVR